MGNLGPLRTEAFANSIKLIGRVPSAWWRFEGECPHCEGLLQPDLTCTLCGGKGVVHKEMALPTTGPTGGRMLLQNARVGQFYGPASAMAGDIYCSFLPTEYPLAEGDWLVPTTREMRRSDRVVRGSTATDPLPRFPVTAVDAVYTASAEVSSSLYALNAAGTGVTWTGGPAAGTALLVVYRFRPTYEVVQGSFHVRERAEDDSAFPSSCLLRMRGQGHLDRRESEP